MNENWIFLKALYRERFQCVFPDAAKYAITDGSGYMKSRYMEFLYMHFAYLNFPNQYFHKFLETFKWFNVAVREMKKIESIVTNKLNGN